MSDIKQVDVLIAGQGAAAFAAGLYAARYQMSILIVGELFGGETAIGGLIENYPGPVSYTHLTLPTIYSV